MDATAEQPAAAPPPAAPKARQKHPVLRWVLRISLGLLILLLLIALVVQIVLWTSVPQSIIVGQVEKGFGLRMGVTGVSTGWLGHTTLRGVKLALPLSDQSFAEVKSMKVDHTNLIGLLLGWPITIKAADLQDPVVYVRQNTAGQWNVQDVAELITRVGGKKTGEETAKTSSTPALPRIRIENATVVVLDNRNHTLKVEAIDVNGEPETPVSYKYDVEIRSHLSLLGRVAPGGTWAHEASAKVSNLAPWVRVWDPSFNQTTEFDGHWAGEMTTGGVRGFLQLTTLQFGPYRADGAVRASRLESVVALSPDNLVLHTGQAALPDVRVPSGEIAYDGKGVRVTRLQVDALGGPTEVNGWFLPSTRQGAMEAIWQNLTVPKSGVKHSGKLELTYSNPIAAPMSVTGTLNFGGTAPQGPFAAVVNFGAQGETLRDVTWNLNAPHLQWKRPEPLVLDGLTANGTYHQDERQQVARLASVSLPSDNRLAGQGFYDLTAGQWKIHLEGQDLPLHLLQDTRLAFGLDATGKAIPSTKDPKAKVQFVELDNFFLASGDSRLSFNGVFDGNQPKPVRADAKFTNVATGPTHVVNRPAIIHGDLVGQLHLDGTLSPMQIAIKGKLDGNGASVLNHPLGDIDTALVGSIDNQKAEIHGDGIPLLGGVWKLGATYVLERDGKQVHATEVALSVSNLPLPHVAAFLQAPQVEGTFGGQWYLYYPGLKPAPGQIALTGGATIRNFGFSYLKADEVSFKTTLNDGVARIDPVRVSVGSYGRIDAHAETTLAQWRQIHAGVTFTAFPIYLPPAALGLQFYGGSDDINVLLPTANSKDEAARKLRVNALLNLRTTIAVREQNEGEVRIVAAMHDRIADLQSLRGDLLGGTLEGQGVTDLDHWEQSRARFDWSKLQTDRLVRLFPQTKGVGGTLTGAALLRPATTPRPLAPLQLDVYSKPLNAHWRDVKLGNAEAHMFVSRQEIIASDQRASTIQLAGGSIDFWFASSSHADFTPSPNGGAETPSGVTISNQLNLSLHNIHIDPFVTSYDPKHPPGFGLADGQVFILLAPKTQTLVQAAQTVTAIPQPGAAQLPPTTGATTGRATTKPTGLRDATTRLASTTRATTRPALALPVVAEQQDLLQRVLSTTTADGTVRITQSNLANFGPVAFLYDTMHVGGNARVPTGHGQVSFHMESGTLHVPNLYYFNQGIEVHGVATAQDLWKLPDNPIIGSVAGSARPLKNIRLPLFAEADAILTGLQGKLISIGFGGTVKHPGNFHQLALTELGGELRGLILSEFSPQAQ